TTTRTRRPLGTGVHGTATALLGRTRTRCRTRRSSRRTGRTTSKAWTSCAPSAASIRACLAACTCTSAKARPFASSTRRCSVRTMAEQARLDDRAVRERVARLEEQLGRLEQIPGRTAELALEAIAGLAELYGEALARAADLARDTPAADALGRDELVRHLFVLHDIRMSDTAPSRASATPLIPVEALARSIPGRVS